ncbi:vWA domain-containing protein [Nocardiopsis suaedae]|uniref:VWA domain-containing protein n=1 Tax=Nocardiopsis suaedae TaxID=3018444 RepID=A0ABT4TVC4_9ACTN|nr:VWA domain-containing protein [Nocardiopsis suaedae]MDA2808612.1 VWA domain-containing protein [Nocardiopsis suaedae]
MTRRPGPAAAPAPPTAPVLGLVRALRAAGVRADTARALAFTDALAAVDAPARADRVYWAGRLTLCSTRADLDIYDACFAAYFGASPPAPRPVLPAPERRRLTALLAPGGRGPDDGGATEAHRPAAASGTEVLRTADLGLLSEGERAEAARLVSLIAADPPRRPTRRTAPARRGRLDPRRTLAAAARTDGEPLRPSYRGRTDRPRKVVVLVDVSGSMAPYAEPLLRLAHVLLRGHPGATEVFSVGTRLTRLTRELSAADPARALRAAGAAVPDWRGGTRLGEELKEFLDLYGRRGAARGAVVLIASDGWERGDASQLGVQMARLSRLAHRTVWANPHKGQAGYRPRAAGMAAALPYIDDFVPGHSLEALERLARAVARGRAEGGGARA